MRTTRVPPSVRERLMRFDTSRRRVPVHVEGRKDVPFGTGMENGITFTGCSCVMSLREPRLVSALGPKDVGVMAGRGRGFPMLYTHTGAKKTHAELLHRNVPARE